MGQTDNRSTAFGSIMNTYEQSETKSFVLRQSNQAFNDDFEHSRASMQVPTAKVMAKASTA